MTIDLYTLIFGEMSPLKSETGCFMKPANLFQILGMGKHFVKHQT